MKRLKFSSLLIIVFGFIFVQSISANWYTGNKRSNAYGVRAFINTPSSAPYIDTSGQSSWVSLPQPYWAQAGWRYYKGWSDAKPYVEYNVPGGGYGITHYGTQGWGTMKEYWIEHSFQTAWCVYIDSSNKGCFLTQSAPRQLQAYSEIHVSSNNVLDTRFDSVRYKNSGGSWAYFDQSSWREDSPYAVNKLAQWRYINYGP